LTPTTTPTLLVVEDDEVSREKMLAYFESEGYLVVTAESASVARRQLKQNDVNLVLLDINLPDGDGLSLAREIRQHSRVGIIFVSGRDDDIDRIVGLEIGADDYVTKPYNPRELLARVRGLLRRTDAAIDVSTVGVRQFEGWHLDPLRRTLTGGDCMPVELTRAEIELLELFTRLPGETLSRERLMAAVTHRSWHPGDRTIDVLIRRLRRKLESDPAKPTMIRTVHGEGYMFCATVSDSSNPTASRND